jgi:hypothetical protein
MCGLPNLSKKYILLTLIIRSLQLVLNNIKLSVDTTVHLKSSSELD